VIGIVTRYDLPQDHGEDPGYNFSNFRGIRRLCLRPNMIEKWRHTSLTRFAAEPKILEKIRLETNFLNSILSVHFSQMGIQGIGDGVFSQNIGRSEMAEAIMAQVRTANAVLHRGGAKLAKPAVVELCQKFASRVQQVYGMGVAGVDESSFSHVNREIFRHLASERRDMCNNINQHLTSQLTSINPYSPR
jgi:hypothetical protein